MRTRSTFLFIIPLLIQLISCAGLEHRKQTAEPGPAAADIKAAISNGQVVKGMSPDEVRRSWGAPANEVSEITADNRSLLTWTYIREFKNFLNTYRVKFADGRVTEVAAAGSQPAPSAAAAPAIESEIENARRYLEYKDRLHLSPDQVSGLESIRNDYSAAYVKKRDSLNLHRSELAGLLKAVSPDPTLIRSKMDDIARDEADLRAAFLAAVNNAYGILTDEQRRILATFPSPAPPR